ncbi:MAG TPA: cytochrome P450 [Actinophytocola sp.]|uniref:cytochrome P450 n=1 Tax=Actinophytocola sp. TaxID=1872138 RepID=UPI002DBB3C38|nr:cytochrome P450 [Actinophytocola sp.]HEU5475940.1 cytochrome P450 [Actinophytocola sp.]
MTATGIGSSYDPLGAHLDDPYSFYAQARREEPVFYSPVFQAWVVTRYEDIRHVLTHPDVFSSANAIRPLTATLAPECMAELEKGYPLTPALLNTDGAAHDRLRAPFIKGLGVKGVRRIEPFIEAQFDALVDEMLPAGTADFMEHFARPVPFRVLARLLGIDESDYQVVYDGSLAGSPLLRSGTLSPREQVDHARRFVRFQHILVSYARARRTEPRSDLISSVVAELAPKDAPFTDERACELLWSLSGVIGSTNSMASILGTGMYYLLADYDRWAALLAGPDLIDSAVEEICRYDPPAQTFPRITTRPVTIGGVDLPEGTELIVMFGSANRDDALVERAHEFDITRRRTQHFTFGYGSHLCLGAPVVRATLRIMLETFARRVPGLRLADGQPVRFKPALNHRQPEQLWITW